MNEPLVLIHGSAAGARSWVGVRRALPPGQVVHTPDLLGYGDAPPARAGHTLADEVAHLTAWLDRAGVSTMHLVAHSYGVAVALHLRRALAGRVTRFTIIDPTVVSILHEFREERALAIIDEQYRAFTSRLADPAAAVRGFLEFWGGADAWTKLSSAGQRAVAGFAPKVALEMEAMRADTTSLAALAVDPPPTTVLLGARTGCPALAVSRHLAPAFGATVAAVTAAGHLLPLTHPREVAQHLVAVETAPAP